MLSCWALELLETSRIEIRPRALRVIRGRADHDGDAIATTEEDLGGFAADRGTHRLPMADDLASQLAIKPARQRLQDRQLQRRSAARASSSLGNNSRAVLASAMPISRIATARSCTGSLPAAIRAASVKSAADRFSGLSLDQLLDRAARALPPASQRKDGAHHRPRADLGRAQSDRETRELGPALASEPARNASSSIHAVAGGTREASRRAWARASSRADGSPGNRAQHGGSCPFAARDLAAAIAARAGIARSGSLGFSQRQGELKANHRVGVVGQCEQASSKSAGSRLKPGFGQSNGLLAYPRLGIVQTQRSIAAIESAENVESPEGVQDALRHWVAS